MRHKEALVGTWPRSAFWYNFEKIANFSNKKRALTIVSRLGYGPELTLQAFYMS